MKISNKWGLPAPLVRAVTQDTYTKEGADYSVTELISPPRISALQKLHAKELEEDASDRLWLLMGKAGHEVLRKSSDGGIVEERCVIEVDGKKVSGQLDYVATEESIIDYKFTSVWAVKDGVKIEWEQQLNLYKTLADQYGVSVRELKIIAILRDWSVREAKRDQSYPQSQVKVLPVRVWESKEAMTFISNRIFLHEAARAGNLPECTSEEMWETPERYAATKKGNQRASRVCDSRLEIGQWVASQPKPAQFDIEVRPSERPRCESYCSVAKFCSVYQDWKRAQTQTQNP